ncbi:trehalose-phosphatase [Sediminivirga luteola]|nr:trehalose-phosphatase [Sediminivirga luteola]MCI2264569.1 trehalose-phosphatase [Sediminivirga luteola]
MVVANRLPVDRAQGPQGPEWRQSPGGLVTGLAPVMKRRSGAWIGWTGAPDEEIEPFDLDDMHLVPVRLSTDDVYSYYEGFSNATLWPLYHDVIVPPEFHRKWWDAYVRVNTRFARAAAASAAPGALVWVHDYQLQLVPGILRELRPDVKIGFFNHIPFPPYEIFAQLPWRRRILIGLLGADLVGFQRPSDTANFRRAVRRTLGYLARNSVVRVPASQQSPEHLCETGSFPISIDAGAMDALARDERIRKRAEEIREEVGNPRTLILGVDRMDYTKGIRHRLKAYEELLEDGRLSTESTTFIQIATPSRERLDYYKQIRRDVELAVGRINGDHSALGKAAVHYLHQSFPREEMAAFYLAADVMLVTALRDGMNLVAKEYVACRVEEDGVLVLSEFTGAADELRQALLVNPHDIAGLKNAITQAVHMTPEEAGRRMRRLRSKVRHDDVLQWASTFLDRLQMVGEQRERTHSVLPETQRPSRVTQESALPADVVERLSAVCSARRLLIALDFDGVLAPLVDDPATSAPLPETVETVHRLAALDDVLIAYVSGRELPDLVSRVDAPPGALFAGSHGAQLDLSGLGAAAPSTTSRAGSPLAELHPSTEEREQLADLDAALDRAAQQLGDYGQFRVEEKALGRSVHTRGLEPEFADRVYDLMQEIAEDHPRLRYTRGHEVREFAVRHSTKGHAITALRAATGADAILYIGDDVTDEDAFARLRQAGPGPDLGLKVGPGHTLAAGRISDPHAVTAVLVECLRLRRSANRS